MFYEYQSTKASALCFKGKEQNTKQTQSEKTKPKTTLCFGSQRLLSKYSILQDVEFGCKVGFVSVQKLRRSGCYVVKNVSKTLVNHSKDL